MADILMVATPDKYYAQPHQFKTLWLSPEEFCKREPFVRAHNQALRQNFRTEGKYLDIVKKATWFVVVQGFPEEFLGSAFVIEVGERWSLEYVQKRPDTTEKKVGLALCDRVMIEAKQRGIRWVELTCDPDKNEGYLPRFYSHFGFKPVA